MAAEKKWGGARQGSGRKPYPEMRPGKIVIDVRNARAYVSRWQRNDGGAFWLEEAANWEDFEDAATVEIENFGGYITLSGIYPCGDELAAKAEWK